MDATEFITLSLALSCTLGPLIGFSMAVGYFILQSMTEREFSLTIGRRLDTVPVAKTPPKEEQAYDIG